MTRLIHGIRRFRAELLVWHALIALLALTLGSAYVPMGTGNILMNMTISVVKTLLVAIFFMNLRTADPTTRLVAGVGALWLGFLFVLTFADILTRG